jgi:DNA-binding MarR family transcriptional regulator
MQGNWTPGQEIPMPPRTPHRLPPEPPPTVREALRKRFGGQDFPALDVVFALRMTAQQVDNTVTEWMAGTAGTPARFQILGRLWASGAGGVPHKEIVKALEVTRATVSGLMTGLERDGLVKSTVDRDDRRNLIATLTSRGRAIFERAIDTSFASLRAAFATLSADELETLMSLLQRLRQGFIGVREDPRGKR